jgi:hypothetical protein
MRSPVGGGSAEAITHDVAAGRIVDLALILIGALIDGYGDLPSRWIESGA